MGHRRLAECLVALTVALLGLFYSTSAQAQSLNCGTLAYTMANPGDGTTFTRITDSDTIYFNQADTTAPRCFGEAATGLFIRINGVRRTGTGVDGTVNTYVDSQTEDLTSAGGSVRLVRDDQAPFDVLQFKPVNAAFSGTDTFAVMDGNNNFITITVTITPPPAPNITSLSPTIGGASGGTSVAISGSNFTDATAVTFGGTTATYSVNSGSSITATAPAHAAGLVDVVVTRNAASSTSAATKFRYLVPATSAASVSPSPIYATQTSTVTVTVTNPNTLSLTSLADSITLPSGVLVSGTPAFTTTCGGAGAATGGNSGFSFTGGSLGASASCQFTFNVTSSSAATYTIPAGAPSSTEGGTGVAGTSASLVVQAAPSAPTISAAFSPTSVAINTASTLTLTLTNPNGSTALTGVAVAAAALPSGLTGSGAATTCTSGTATYNSGTRNLSLAGGTLNGGATCNVTLSVQASSPGTFGYTTGAPSASGPVAVTGIAASAPTSLTVTQAAPTVTSLSPASGTTLGGTSVAITGTGFTNVTSVTFGGTAAGSTTVNSATSITAVSPAHVAGATDVVVTTSGGTNANSAADDYTFIAPPAAPAVDTPANNARTNNNTPLYSGTAGASLQIEVYVDSSLMGTTTSAAGGAWSITQTPALADGSHSVYALAVNGGVKSIQSNTNSFTVDTIAPAAPSVTAPTSGSITNDNTPTFTGTAEANSTVRVFIDSVFSGTATLTGTSWTYTPTTLADGNHSFWATATDLAGNLSSQSTTGSLTVDTAAPAAPVIGAPSAGASTSTTPTISGTAEANATVSVTVDSTTVATTADGSGNWSLVWASLAAGAHSVSATARDAALNTSASSGSVSFTVVNAPVASSFTYGSIVPYNVGGDPGTLLSVAFAVTNSPASYAVGSATTSGGGSVSIDNSGQVSFTPAVGRRGNDTFTYTATNAGGTSAPATVTVAVGNPTFAFTLNGSGTRGAALSGVQIDISGGKAPYGCGTSVATGALPAGTSLNNDCTITGTPTASGSFTFKVTAVDSSTGTGPFTQTSPNLTLIVAVPTLTIATNAPTGTTTVGAAYSQTNPASGGDTPYTYSLASGSVPVGTTLNTGTGTVSGTPAAVGAFSYTVKVTDSQGTPATATGTLVSGTIAKGDQTSSFTSTAPAAASVGGATYTPAASATSGLPVSVAIDSTSSGVCTKSGAIVSFIGAGTCTINADQPGNPNWNAAQQVQQSFAVGQGTQTISFTSTAPAAAVVGSATYTPTATASSGLTVAFTIAPASSGVCTISGGVVNFTGVGTCTVNADQPGDANWSAAPQVQQAFAVGQGSQTIGFTSAAPTGATVGGATYTPTATATSGLTVAFTIAPSSSGVCAISSGVVSFTGIGTCTINANQPGNASWTAAAQVQQGFAVGQGGQTIAFTSTAPSAAAVGGATYTPTATATSGLTVAFTLDASSAGVCTISGGVISFTSAGTCTVNADQPGNADWTAAPRVQQSFAVGQGAQTIAFTSTAPAAAAVNGATYTPSATATSGLAVVFTVDASSSGVCTISGGIVSFTAAGTCTINANQAGNSNWSAAPQVQQSFGVGQGSQTIGFTSTAPASATVGGATYTPAATATSGLAVLFTADASSSSVCSISGGAVSFTGAGTCTINANQPGNSSWSAAPQVQQSFGVGQGGQTISFTSTAPTATVGGATYTPTATATSGLTVTFAIAPASGAVCSLSSGVVSFTAAGTCTIDATQAGNSNWTAASLVQQSFSVGQGAQTIGFTSTAPASAAVNGATYTPTATATSGLAVTFAIAPASSAVCAISSGAVSFTGAGTCTINASQAGNSSWNAAPQAQQSFTVGQGGQTIGFTSTAPAAAAVGGAAYTPAATATSGLIVGFTIAPASGSVCALSGGSVSFTAIGTCTVNANQPGDSNWDAAPQVQQSFTVGQGSQTIGFTSAAPASAAVSGATYTPAATATSGLAVNFAIAPASSGVCSLSGAAVSFTAAGTCTINANQPGDSSWIAAPQVQQSFAVGQGSQTIAFTSTAPASAIVNGATYTPAATATSGLTVSLAVAPSSSGVCAFSSGSVSFIGAGTCVINATQPGNADWSAAPQVQQSFAVNPELPTLGIAISHSGNGVQGQSLAFTITPSATVNATGGTITASFALPAGMNYGSASGSGWTCSGSGNAGSCTSAASIASGANGNAITLNVNIAANAGSPLSPAVTLSGGGAANSPNASDATTILPPVPVAGSFAAAIAYQTATPVDLSASITGGPHASIAVATAPAHGTTAVSGDVVTYTPSAGYFGTDAFTYIATGPGGASSPGTVSLTVGPPAAPTVADRNGIAVPHNSSGTAIDLVSAISGVHGAIAVATAPAHGTASVSGDVVTYTPAAGYYGADSFTYTAIGPGGTSAPATVGLIVGTPPAPVAADRSGIAVAYGSTGVAIDLSGSVTGVHASLAVVTAPAHGTASVSGDTITYTPTASYFGADSFTYAATGPGGTSPPATVGLTVATPAAPTVADKNGVLIAYNGTGTPIDLAASITGVHASIAIGTAPAHGTTTISGDVVTYTPAAGYHGADSFTYTATGPGGTSGAATVRLAVAPPPPPVVRPGTSTAPGATVNGNDGVEIDLSALITGEYDSIRIDTPPAHGVVTLTGPSANGAGKDLHSAAAAIPFVATYRPAMGFVGTDSFTFVAHGAGGDSAPATVTITVVGMAPVAQARTASTGDGQTVSVDLTAGATDGPFTAANVVSVTPAGSATTAIVASGTGYRLDVTPKDRFGGTIVVSYTLSNIYGTSAPATVTLSVTARPDPTSNPSVRAVSDAQAEAARRFARTQVGNFMRRNETLHGSGTNDRAQMDMRLGFQALLDPNAQRRERSIWEDASPNGVADLSRSDATGPERRHRTAAGDAGDSEAQPGENDRGGNGPHTREDGSVAFWTGGQIDIGKRDATSRRLKIKATSAGLSGGADIQISDALTVGIGAGYGAEQADIESRGRVESDSKVAAIYGSAEPVKGSFIDGVLGIGDLDFRTRRLVEGTQLTYGRRDGDMIFGSLAAGIDRNKGDIRWSLYGRGEFLDATLDSYSESGGGRLDLRFDERDVTSITGTLGGRFEISRHTRHGLLVPRIGAEWHHEFEDSSRQGIDYADIIGPSLYGIDTEGWAREQFEITIGSRFEHRSGWQFDLEVGARVAAGERAGTLKVNIAKDF